MNYQLYGPGHMLLATLLVAASSVLARVAYDDGANPLAFVMVRAGIAVAVLGVWLVLAAEPWKLSNRDRNRAMVMGLIVAVSHYALNVAIAVLPVSVALVMFYFHPVITAIVNVAVRRETLTVQSMAAIALACLGMAFVLPGRASEAEVIALWCAGLSAVAWSVVTILTAVWFPRGDARPRTLYMIGTAFVVTLLFAVFSRNVEWPNGPGGGAAFIGGALAFALGLVGLFVTMSALGPMRAAFYMNFEPLCVLVLAGLALTQPLGIGQLFGALTVIGAIFLFRLPPRWLRLLGRRR